MHDFFDKLGAAAKRAAGTVANEVSLAAEKQKLSDAYRDLGKMYYQTLKLGQTPELDAWVAKVDEALARIESLKDRHDVTSIRTAPEVTADEPDFVVVEE